MPFDAGDIREAVDLGDHRGLRQVCLDAADDGTSVAEIVAALARLQVEAGERWLKGDATVAEEHRSTAAVDTALAALELHLGPPPPVAPVISVCAEGEWHAIASRMAALLFSAAGRPTVFLGPSLPPDDLSRFVSGAGAAAVAITCSTVAALPGAARCVTAARATGVTVLVGGQAFRALPAAAAALGAVSLDDPAAAVSQLSELGDMSSPDPELDPMGVAALDLVRGSLIEVASNGLLARRSVIGGAAGVVEEAVEYALGFSRAAVLLRDRSVLRAHAAWLDAFLAARVAPVTADDLLSAVGCAVAEVLSGRKDLHEVLVP